MKRKVIIKLGGLVLLILFIGITLAFTGIQRKMLVCDNVAVWCVDDLQFVSEKKIINDVLKVFPDFDKAKLDTLNTNAIEELVEQNPWVKNAEVFKGYSKNDSLTGTGVVRIKIEQEKPIMRVVHGAEGYYMNEFGKHLPFSALGTANVLVVTGAAPDSIIIDQVLPFVKYVRNHEFWNAQIQQIHVRKNSELVLVPRVGNHKIEFGTTHRKEEKFRNLMAVYKQGFSANNGWDKYKTVSLKFDNQVICTRK